MTLLQRLEAAEGACRELDALVEVERRKSNAHLLGLGDDVRAHWKAHKSGKVYDGHTSYEAPKSTDDLNDAIKSLDHWAWILQVAPWVETGDGRMYHAMIGGQTGEHKTPALAICIAAIKARSEATGPAVKGL